MKTDSDNWRGVFVIVTTAFNEDLSLDREGLERTVQFCIDAGADGVVATANASEVAYLTDVERRIVAETVVQGARGHVPALVGVSSSCHRISCDFAEHAAHAGADGIMAMPPAAHRPAASEIHDFFRHLAQATDLPIMLQNYGGIGGTAMSVDLMLQLVRDLPTVSYLKEETDNSSEVMSELLAANEPGLKGVFGGKAGIRLLDEHARGSCGTMPACEVSDVHSAIWNALESGDSDDAVSNFLLLLPLLVSEMGQGPSIYKYVLQRRGVISSRAFRQTGGPSLDQHSRKEIDTILDRLKDHMGLTKFWTSEVA